jgi:hypothetical protein
MLRRTVTATLAVAVAATLAATPAQARKYKPLKPHGQWVRLTDGIADAVAEGDYEGTVPTSKDGCLMRVTKRFDVTIVCPDGRRIRA